MTFDRLHPHKQNSLGIEYVRLSQLRLPENQARRHPKRQIQKLKNSIGRYGIVSPVLINDDLEVIAGTGRVLALRELAETGPGYEEVPAVRISHLTPAQIRAYRLADNRLAEDANWDVAALKLDFEAILEIDSNFNLEETGFELPEIDLALHPADLGRQDHDDPDDAEVGTTTQAISRPGDLWLLGEHRLLCADATNKDAMDILLYPSIEPSGRAASTARPTGAQPDQTRQKTNATPQHECVAMAFTDPPYNVPVQGHISGKGRARHREFVMASGEMPKNAFVAFLKVPST